MIPLAAFRRSLSMSAEQLTMLEKAAANRNALRPDVDLVHALRLSTHFF